ncbi:LuxR C-terminal-related transcriptional regulator [Kitasatospora aureofaciens]|uniref:helix-turn-helix transcriptional regulator n=1 Tax=Kitasatospora aureofaciens TaxID=1894 RepID=UPI001C452EF0|nr:LuxR C-terminal-related transcriptional regulator [Kitasatospora aureofaciens]MBV6701294.1 LuxR C-terminal-related transcriptional regulator [Kitasatospora aureofaciens]
MAAEAGCSLAEAEHACERLNSTGLLAPSPGAPCGFVTVDPEAALTRLFSAEERLVTAHLQHVARIRTAISSLVHGFPDLRDERREAVEVETLETPALVNAFLDDAGSMVRTRLRAMHPGGPPPEELIDDMLLRDKEMEGRGIAVDGLYQRRTAAIPYMAAYLVDAARPGKEVRVAEYLPLRMILFDDELAVLPINPEDSSQGAFAIHGKELVASLHALYDYCWHNATPVQQAPEQQAVALGLDSQELVVVKLLADGVKDEAIARQLGISPRTFSRIVSGLLERLGVKTRFQAAMRIAELGLLG